MQFFRATRRTVFITLGAVAGVYLFYLLFAWLALPRILQSQAERYIEEKSAHHLTMERPEFNPFTLALTIPKLRLAQPDGSPLLAFDELFVDLSAGSVFHRAFVFDAIRLASPQVTVVLRGDGTLNWTPLIEALKSKEPEPKSQLPRLDVRSFALSGGHVDFADRKAGFASRIEPLDVQLDELSTLPDEEGRYRIAARTSLGAQIAWRGDVDLQPMAISGHLEMAGLDLAKLAPYLKPALPEAPAGIASVQTDFRAGYADGKLSLTVEGAKAGVKDLRLPTGRGPALAIAAASADGGRFDLAGRSLSLARFGVENAAVEWPKGGPAAQKLGDLSVEDIKVDFAKRIAAVATIALKNGDLKAVRRGDGKIDLVDALQHALPPGGKKAETATEAPWHFAVGKAELLGFAASLRDETTKPAAMLALEDFAVSADKLSDDLAAPVAVEAGFRASSGGRFKAAGQVVPAAPSADMKIELADLALKPAEPYLAAVAKLSIAGGRLSVDGKASYGKAGPAFKGGFRVQDLRLDEAGTKNRFVIWKSLSSKTVEATSQKLFMRELALDGLDAALLIAKDKSVNLTRILQERPAEKATPKPAEAAGKPASPFVADIARLRVTRAEMDFADQSLALPFGTRIHHLHGFVTGLSTRTGAAPGVLELEGQVDDYGLARAAGRIELFNPTDFADVNLVFRNVEMTRLTPYSATFLGRKITSGKLSLDLQYKFDKRQVQGDNKVIMDRLTLGERVESPEAKNLPLDLAIAILQDSDGRIELGLPVSGSLDDPHFSYGSIVWKAIVNVLTKIATAPFRALASLFGGGEKMDSIAFDAGNARLTPPEREKLVRVAGILGKRPGLALTVHGTWADVDRAALQERQLRRTVAQKAGIPLEADQDPGPLSTQDPKVRSAIEDLFADRFGGAELAALKDGYRKANPGQLPESTAGKVMSRLTNLIRQPRALGDEEIAQLKGADFYAVLFERLRAREPMPDERLQALAKSRGDFAANALKEAGAPPDRLSLGAPERVEAAEKEVPLKLDVGTAGR
ncbi:MAG TPA: DUF748 domain-containing protein [Rhodocyclaceae bacterium]